jgi:sugar (pentulose or hexulose) kinase
MESTARSLAALLDSACVEGRPPRILSTGGGARSDTWLQIKADMLGSEIVAGSNPEPGSYGAALLASVAAGRHRKLIETVESFVTIDRVFPPNPGIHRFYTAWLKEYAARFPVSG